MKEIPIDAALLANDGPVLASYSAHLIPAGTIAKPFKIGAYEFVITATERNKNRQAVKVWARKVVYCGTPEDNPDGTDGLVAFGGSVYLLTEQETVFFAAPGSLKAPPPGMKKPRQPRPAKPGQGGLF
jgi:hypothetical protein